MANKFEGFAREAKTHDESTCLALIDSAYQYLINPSSVPLGKVSLQFRPLFSASYDILNKASRFNLKTLQEQIQKTGTPKSIIEALIQKIAKIQGIQEEKIILSGFYAKRPFMSKNVKLPDLTPINQRKESMALKQGRSEQEIGGLKGGSRYYRGVKWSVNVVLSTSRLNKVLKPEIKLQILDDRGEKTEFFMTVETFQELRRQGAVVVKCLQQIEQIKFLK